LRGKNLRRKGGKFEHRWAAKGPATPLRFFSHANGRITTKLAHDGLQVSVHPGCAQGQGQGQRSRDRALLCWHENRFFSQANGPIVTKLAHDGLCIQGVLKVEVKGHVIRALSWILGMSYSVIDGLVKI